MVVFLLAYKEGVKFSPSTINIRQHTFTRQPMSHKERNLGYWYDGKDLTFRLNAQNKSQKKI